MICVTCNHKCSTAVCQNTHLLKLCIFSSLAAGPNADTSSHACTGTGSGHRPAPNTNVDLQYLQYRPYTTDAICH